MSDWLHGPPLASWLEDHGLTAPERQLGFHTRALRHWRGGGAANVYTVDKVCVKLDLHISQIPAEIWGAEPPQKNRLTPGAREIIREQAATSTVRELAQEYGCDQKTVRRVLAA